MILTFAWPSIDGRSGGVTVLYELASGLAGRGHEVHFIHGPAWPGLIDSLDQVSWFDFHPGVQHHIVHDFATATLPRADISFAAAVPGDALPCSIIQGYRMLDLRFEREAFVSPGPKVCVASWLVDVGRSFGVPAQRLWHVPPGLDHELFTPPSPEVDRPFDVAMWDNPHPQKGTVQAWEALRLARQARPDLRAVVFTAGPLDSRGRQRAEAMPWVHVVTGLDRRGLVECVYQQSKVFLQMSLVEGFGYTAVEAMACGAVLVTTDNGGSRDYAFDGETARVCPPRDPVAVAAAIVEVLADDERRGRMAAAGERTVRRFDWDRSVAALDGHLEAYLADPEAFLAPLEHDTDPACDPMTPVLGPR